MKHCCQILIGHLRRRIKVVYVFLYPIMLVPSNKGTRLPSILAGEFYNVFSSKSTKRKFKFLRKYFLYVEDNNSFIAYRFVISTSLLDAIDDTKEVIGFNKICKTFLLGMVTIGNSRGVGIENYAMGCVYLGLAYEFGVLDYPRNEVQAFFYYRKAAVHRNPFGCFKYGQCFERGLCTKQDSEKTHAFYKLSANLGCVEALHTLGVILMHGLCGIDADIFSGLFYLQLAAKKSDYDYPFTYYDFGVCYDATTTKCVFKDDVYAYDLYQKGAILGCPNSQFRLGNIFYMGQLKIEADLHKAVYWYQTAAKSGHIEAQIILAQFYGTGMRDFLSRDPKQAYILTLKAASKGSTEAAFQLGTLIENGIGVEKDPVHALWWYNIAASLNHKDAEYKIKELSDSISTPVAKKGWWLFSILGRGG